MDIWALGVTLYCMVHGSCPFQDRIPMLLFDKITNHEIILKDSLSNTLKDLIKRMLDKNSDTRITIAELKVHPWLTMNGTFPLETPEESMISEEITPEDVEMAFSPVIRLVVTKFINMFKGISGSSSILRRPRTMDDLREVSKPPIPHLKSTNSVWKSGIWRSHFKISPSVDVLNGADIRKHSSENLDNSIFGEELKSLGLCHFEISQEEFKTTQQSIRILPIQP